MPYPMPRGRGILPICVTARKTRMVYWSAVRDISISPLY